MMKRTQHTGPEWMKTGSKRFRQDALRLVIHLLALTGMTVIYYIGFSFLVDTPTEYNLKRSTDELETQYHVLTARYDSVEQVLRNVVERDRSVFRALFESEPYDFDSQFAYARWTSYERLLGKSNRELGDGLFAATAVVDARITGLDRAFAQLQERATALGGRVMNIPAIQPVINKDLTLLTASYGQRIHPFYKTLVSHQGVDYTVPEGSRVFATADGVVSDVVKKTTSGTTIIISHGNGYETVYGHLSQSNVRKGERVSRGDIIALSGNTGLSLAPHLHYEVIRSGMRVDPIHYFFMELSPTQYQKMIKIAQSGMQSFD